ncbi:hypothetical protein T4D_1341 [Trichinella pseudospiralis]|uniref:Uncharacterized protein n=1 Tax=Trichinella pseudospiralis TaxID=6337 RepID=A0A0V1DMQ8_TRIPS|nr:hypothetical protein T4D_1341 [Trichinella pseudospiralis]
MCLKYKEWNMEKLKTFSIPGQHEAEQENKKGICGSPWVSILYFWAKDTLKE